jgi:glycosyltransferase involved in cell wall biosynthesis
MKSYNITFVSSHLGHVRGGAELNDLKLGEELDRLGHNLQYVTQQDPKRSPRKLSVDGRVIKAPYLYGLSYDLPEPVGKVLRHLNEVWFKSKIKRTCPSEVQTADLVLTTGRPLLVDIQSITDAPVVHAVRGTVNSFYHRYLKQADGLIFWGGCESEYKDQSVLAQPRLTLDPAVNTVFQPREVTDSFRNRWREDEELLVGFVGRLEPVKRVDALIDAVASTEHEVRLLVVGDGSRRENLEAYAKRVAPDRVEFLGYQDQKTIAKLLNVVDVFALASERENHPIALKEALASGTYCIAPAVGRVDEMISSQVGTVMPDNDTETILSAINQVAESDTNADERFERAQQQNKWQENARAVVNFYEDTLRDDT